MRTCSGCRENPRLEPRSPDLSQGFKNQGIPTTLFGFLLRAFVRLNYMKRKWAAKITDGRLSTSSTYNCSQCLQLDVRTVRVSRFWGSSLFRINWHRRSRPRSDYSDMSELLLLKSKPTYIQPYTIFCPVLHLYCTATVQDLGINLYGLPRNI